MAHVLTLGRFVKESTELVHELEKLLLLRRLLVQLVPVELLFGPHVLDHFLDAFNQVGKRRCNLAVVSRALQPLGHNIEVRADFISTGFRRSRCDRRVGG